MRVMRLVWMSLMVAAMPARAQTADETARIRDARVRSNVAIAAHDIQAIVAELDSAYHVTAGSGRFIAGPRAMGDAFAAQFAEFPDARYVRSTDAVEVAGAGTRAFEVGSWVGTWTTPTGPVRTGGRYSAHWVKAVGAWKIRSELFVTLYCDGAGCV